MDGWAGLGLTQNGNGPHCSSGPGPTSLFPLHKQSSNIQSFKLLKYETLASLSPKFLKRGMAKDKFKRTTSLFGRSSNSKDILN
jgi:hypothetical protein